MVPNFKKPLESATDGAALAELLRPLDGEALDFDEGDKLWVRISAILVQKTSRLFAQGLGQFPRGVAQGQVHHARARMKVLAAVDLDDGGVLSALQNNARCVAPAQHMPEPIRKSSYPLAHNLPPE